MGGPQGAWGSERRASFSSTPFLPSLSAAAAPSGSPTPQRLPLLASERLRSARRRDTGPRPPSTCADVDESTHCACSDFAFPVACVRLPPSGQKKKKPSGRFAFFVLLNLLCFFLSSVFVRDATSIIHRFFTAGPRGQRATPAPPNPQRRVCININQLGLWYVKTAQTEVM